MASKKIQESSASVTTLRPYDVFLSFRGEDTRKTFTDHLYTALASVGFHTFRDDDAIGRGEKIKSELERAIEQSRISIVVFSKNYAFSRWCLDELVEIVRRQKTFGLFVLPVFYDVEPSQVRVQSGSFKMAFDAHEKRVMMEEIEGRKQELIETIKMWRSVLTEVAGLKGMVLQNEAHGYEAKFIKKIVRVIGEKLNRKILPVGVRILGRFEEFDLDELLEATNYFSNDCKLGMGGFGSVYHAILEDGREVAVKRAERSPRSSYPYSISSKLPEHKDREFLIELEFLSRVHHKNIIRLLGFYVNDCERVLVFEYAHNGSLHDHIHNNKQFKTASELMSWTMRIKVALDVARGIEYLHEYAVPQIIHRDIKSSNILLDRSWIAKVADCGFSVLDFNSTDRKDNIVGMGTVGYMDPEYISSCRVTRKTDVYAFGVVLLELLTGRKAIFSDDQGVPKDVISYVVPHIKLNQIDTVLDKRLSPPTASEREALADIGNMAVKCIAMEGRDRPSMTKVVGFLETALCSLPSVICFPSPTKPDISFLSPATSSPSMLERSSISFPSKPRLHVKSNSSKVNFFCCFRRGNLSQDRYD